MEILTFKEEIILSALVMLGESSRGALVRKKVIEISKKEIVYGTLYNLMEVLIRKGYVTTSKTDPVPVQGGRSKTIYTITKDGKNALQETLKLHEDIRENLPHFEIAK